MGKKGLTIYGCEKDEAMLFQKYSKSYDLKLKIVRDAVTLENASLAGGNKCISVSHKTEVTLPVLKALEKKGVRYISTRSIGLNHIDVKAAQRLGICIDNVVYSPNGVADYTLMLMLMGLRNTEDVLRRADEQNFKLAARGKELSDMTVGVLGTGRIGQAVIKRLTGFGCKVLAYDREKTADVNYANLDDVLEQSDIVTLHMPLDVETRHMLDDSSIAKMKKDALIVNTGRGALIDTEALVQALESGRLGGAVLDVIEGEEGIFYHNCKDEIIPNELFLRLRKLSNVTITPHVAFYTEHALKDVVENTIKNCLEYERRIEKWID